MSNYELALEVISGKWGNGPERKQRLSEAGYDYNAVQSIVNAILSDTYTAGPADHDTVADQDVLEIDYDPEKHKGIQINIIV